MGGGGEAPGWRHDIRLRGIRGPMGLPIQKRRSSGRIEPGIEFGRKERVGLPIGCSPFIEAVLMRR